MEEMGRSKKAAEELFCNFQDKFYDLSSSSYQQYSNCSPTKRLIQMKNTTTKHHIIESQKGLTQNNSYQITYTTSPEKSYVVKPDGGEIQYDKYGKKSCDKLVQKIINGKVE